MRHFGIIGIVNVLQPTNHVIKLLRKRKWYEEEEGKWQPKKEKKKKRINDFVMSLDNKKEQSDLSIS